MPTVTDMCQASEMERLEHIVLGNSLVLRGFSCPSQGSDEGDGIEFCVVQVHFTNDGGRNLLPGRLVDDVLKEHRLAGVVEFQNGRINCVWHHGGVKTKDDGEVPNHSVPNWLICIDD